MKKFTLFLSLFFAMAMTALAQDYSLSENRLNAEELNEKTSATFIAIKNLSATNHYYFVGNTDAAPYSAAEFSDAAVFIWQPVQEGVAGSYYLRKPDGSYMQTSSPKDFGSVDNAAVFTAANPTQAGTDASFFNGDGDSRDYIDDEALLVRFVNASGSWINVQNGDAGTPVYNTGKGGWTIHHVYEVNSIPKIETLAVVSIEPAEVVENSFSKVIVTFNKEVKKSTDVSAGALVYFDGKVVANTYVSVDPENAMQAIIEFEKELTAFGDYEVYFTEGLFTTLDGKEQIGETKHKVTLVASAPVVVDVTPAPESTVQSLSKFTLTFDKEVRYVESDETGVMFMLNGMPACGALVEVSEEDAKVVNISVDMEMTMEGVYTLYVAEGTFESVEGAAKTPEMMYNWTIEAPLSVVSVDPAEGKIEKAHKFTLTFNREVKKAEGDEYGAMILFNGMPACGALVTVSEEDAKVVNVEMDMEVAMVGEYMLYIAEGTFQTLDGAQSTPELMFSWTIAAPEFKQVMDVAELSNNRAYHLVSKDVKRGAMYAPYKATMVDMCGAEYDMGNGYRDVAMDANDMAQQFAFVQYNGKYYMYNVLNKAFVSKDGDVNKLAPANIDEYVTVTEEVEAAGEGFFSLMMADVAYMTASPGWCAGKGTCNITTLTSQDPNSGWDDGAWYTITEAAVFDATEALAMLEAADQLPLAVVSVDPAEGKIEKAHKFTLTFNQEVKMVEGDEYGAMILFNGMPACGALVTVSEEDAKVVNIEMDMEVAMEGEYMLYIAEGTFQTLDGAQSTPELMFTWTIAAPAPAVEILPTPSENAEALPTTITLNFKEEIGEVVSAMIRTNNTGFRGYILTEEDYTIEGKVMTIQIAPQYIAYCPHLSLFLEVKDVNGNLVGYGDSEEAISVLWVTEVPANIFQLTEVTPAANSDVDALNTFEIMFSHPTGQSYIGGFDETKQIVLKNEAGDVVANGTVVLNEEEFFAPAQIVLDKEVKEIGMYTLVIPEGTFYNESYNPELADFGVAEYGAIYNPEITLTYNVVVPTCYLYHPNYNGLLQMAADGTVASLNKNIAGLDDYTAYGWQFVPATDEEGNELENKYLLYNVATQLYLGACAQSKNVAGVAAEEAVAYEWKKDGEYDVFQDAEAAGDYNYLHIAGHNALVGWTADAGASHWFVLNSVEELQNVLANRALESTLAAKVAKAEKAIELSQPYFKPLITDAAQFSSNNQDPEEGSYADLLDGDATTFFHSNWHGGGPEPHDLQVVLKDNELTAFLVKYVSRNSSGYRNDRPVHMKIYGGMIQEDGTVAYSEEHFAELTTADGIGEVEGEFKFTADAVYDAFRFEVLETVMTDGSKGKVFFTYGEFQMFSQEMSPAELELTEEEATALTEAIEAAQNAHLVKDNYQALVDALDEAIINAFNYDRDVMTLVEDAKAILAKKGVGYPTLESEARATFQAAIDAVDAEPVAEAGATLKAAIEAYCGTTDVALPADGKYYTFTMVAKNGNQFYLNYTGSDVEMVAREEGAKLPESAKYRAELNENGTYSFVTNDGKYLVYHSKYNGVNWLEGNGNTTGFQEGKDKMTDITLAKMVNEGQVAADNNLQIFGLMTWYSLRGYDTGKQQDAYGYMVLKTDASDYDGASAPFWNDNFSSAFLVEETAGPAVIADPAPGFYEEGLPATVKLTFGNGIQAVDFAMVRTATSMRGIMLDESNYTVEGNVMTINLPEEALSGTSFYTLTLQVVDNSGGYVTYGDEDMEEYVVLTYETTQKSNLFNCSKITPAEGEVEELESFVLKFDYTGGMFGTSFVGGFDTTKQIVLKNEAGEVVANATIDFTDPEYYTPEATITLDKKVTAAGVYTLVVPEGTVYNEGYYPEAEDLGVSFGAVYNPELTFTYTIAGEVDEYPINFGKDTDATRTDRVLSAIALTVDGQEAQVIEVANTGKAYNDMSAAEVKFVCAAGDWVTPSFTYSGSWMHGYVYIDFDNDKMFSFDATQNDQTGTDLVSYSFYGVEGENSGYNSVGDFIEGNARNTITCPTFVAPETPGEYRIRFKVDWNNVDAGGCIADNNHILSNGGYIIDATLVVGEGVGIGAVTVEGAKDVYTVDGRKVAVKAGAKLNKGIYIVNGKKVYVK